MLAVEIDTRFVGAGMVGRGGEGKNRTRNETFDWVEKFSFCLRKLGLRVPKIVTNMIGSVPCESVHSSQLNWDLMV